VATMRVRFQPERRRRHEGGNWRLDDPYECLVSLTDDHGKIHEGRLAGRWGVDNFNVTPPWRRRLGWWLSGFLRSWRAYRLRQRGCDAMKPGSVMRVVRPTDNLAKIVKMYVKGLLHGHRPVHRARGLSTGQFLGTRSSPITSHSPRSVATMRVRLPPKDHSWFSTFRTRRWAESCQQMVSAGFRVVPPPIHTGIVVAGRSRTLTATRWCCKRASVSG